MSLLRKVMSLDENVPQKKKDPANEKQNPDICFVDSENSEEDIPKKA